MPDRGQILQELARRGALPEQHKAEYEQMRDAGTIAPKGGFKPMPDASATKLEEQVSAYAGLDRAVTNFKDDYSGVGSSVENMAQGWLGTGTPGQRDWWSDFKASDNQVRNALFGASLTPSEQASYAATSITPSMAPAEIRANLERRRTLARDMLGRRAAFARTNGYTPEAVTAILGDYDPAKLSAASAGTGARPGDPFAPQQQALSVENIADFAAGLSGGKYEVTENGATYNGKPIDLSDEVANSEAYGEAYHRKFGRYPLLQVSVEGERPTIDKGDGITGAALRGVGDTATFGTLDELGGVVDTVLGEGDDGDFQDRLGQNILRNRAIMAGDEKNHPYARVGGQLLGGALVPFGAGARSAGELARVGAIGGSAYGFGSGKGNVLERTPNALGGAVLGGVGGYAFGRAAPVIGDALARVGSRTPSAARVEANALAQAGERQGVPMMAADLRPGARNINALMEASPGSAGPVQNALAAGTDALEGAAGRIGGGTAQSPEMMGTTIQNAGRRMIDRTRQVKNDHYAEAERLSGSVTVRSQGALDAIDRNIAELSETPNANSGLLSLLQDMRADLVLRDASTGRYTPRPLTIGAVRNLRTAMRGEIGSRNLTMTDAERRVSQVIDAASADIGNALNSSNPRAAAAFRRADQYYAQRQDYIRNVVEPYVGPRDRPYSGEQTYQRVMALAGEKGSREQLAATMRGLSPEERADMASTVATSLGRRAPEDDFSPARFVTQVQKMPAAEREVVFGQEGADAIHDLLAIASAKRDTANSLNRSRSGQVSNYDRLLTGGLSLLGAGGGYAAGGAGGAALGAVAAGAAKAGALNLSARLLTNPRFVTWLGRAPTNASPAQITQHVRQLGNLAIREPAIRGELGQLQRLLAETTTTRSMASEREGGDQQGAYGNQAAAAGR